MCHSCGARLVMGVDSLITPVTRVYGDELEHCGDLYRFDVKIPHSYERIPAL